MKRSQFLHGVLNAGSHATLNNVRDLGAYVRRFGDRETYCNPQYKKVENNLQSSTCQWQSLSTIVDDRKTAVKSSFTGHETFIRPLSQPPNNV